MQGEIQAIVGAVGLFSGGIGVSIAIWMQLISEKNIMHRYSLGFLALGSSLILLNIGFFPRFETDVVVISKLTGYVILIVFQMFYAVYVWNSADFKNSGDTVGSAAERV